MALTANNPIDGMYVALTAAGRGKQDRIHWAIYREPPGAAVMPDRFEIGLKNLTKDEAGAVLVTLLRLQMARDGEIMNPTEFDAAFAELDKAARTASPDRATARFEGIELPERKGE